MKNHIFCFALLFLVCMDVRSQNRSSYYERLPIYSIVDDTLKKIVEDFIDSTREKQGIVFFNIKSFPDSTYSVILHLSDKSLIYEKRYLYEHPKFQQFIIEYKNKRFASYFFKGPLTFDGTPKDTSVFEIPFLRQTQRSCRIRMIAPPKGYYDGSYLGKDVDDKDWEGWAYWYKDGIFEHEMSYMIQR